MTAVIVAVVIIVALAVAAAGASIRILRNTVLNKADLYGL